MARTPYEDPEAEAAYQEMNVDNRKLAGDVVPLRPSGPTTNAGAWGQGRNEKAQNPNLDKPENKNIRPIR